MTTSSKRALLGCIADDFTGATDLANMLVRGGMRTVQTIGVPASTKRRSRRAGGRAEIAHHSRCRCGRAIARRARLVARARMPPVLFQILLDLRFDRCGQYRPGDRCVARSVARGTGATAFTIACPAFPENGRTIIAAICLSAICCSTSRAWKTIRSRRCAMRTSCACCSGRLDRKSGCVRYDAVAKGVSRPCAKLRCAAQRRRAHRDCRRGVRRRSLQLGEACADLTLITGGSGVALGLPGNFRRAGLLRSKATPRRLPRVEGLSAVLAGSARKRPTRRCAAWRATRPAFRIDPLAVGARRDGGRAGAGVCAAALR